MEVSQNEMMVVLTGVGGVAVLRAEVEEIGFGEVWKLLFRGVMKFFIWTSLVLFIFSLGVSSYGNDGNDPEKAKVTKVENGKETGFTCVTSTMNGESQTRCAPAQCWGPKKKKIICEHTTTNSSRNAITEDSEKKEDLPRSCEEAVRKSCNEIFEHDKKERIDQLTKFGEESKKELCQGKKDQIRVAGEVWQKSDTGDKDSKKIGLSSKKDDKTPLPNCEQVRSPKFKISKKNLGRMCFERYGVNGVFAEAPRTVWFTCETAGSGEIQDAHERFKKKKKKDLDRR